MRQQDRFENHMDVASPETIGDAKQLTEIENSDDSEFETKLDNYYKFQKVSNAATMLGNLVSTFAGGYGETKLENINSKLSPKSETIVIENRVPTFSDVSETLDEMGYCYDDQGKTSTEKAIVAMGGIIDNLGSDESSASKSLEESISDANEANTASHSISHSTVADGGDDSPDSIETAIDGKVTDISRQELPDSICSSFQNGDYRTVRTTEDITLYRVFGGNAQKEGCFLTTEIPSDRLDTKVNSALLPEWKNTRQYYCEVSIPAGTVLNIGKVAAQKTMEGHLLPGGSDQVYVSADFAKNKEHYGDTKPLGFGGSKTVNLT